MSDPTPNATNELNSFINNYCNNTNDIRLRTAEMLDEFFKDNDELQSPFERDFMTVISNRLLKDKENTLFSTREEIIMETLIRKYNINKE